MKEQTAETILGALVALIAIGFFAFAFTRSGEASGAGGASNSYFGLFLRADGITPGSDVRLAGVKVGVVTAVRLDPETYYAHVTMAVDRQVELLDQTTASIRSDSLLGGAHVALEPAGLDPLASGDEIVNTEGSRDIFSLLLAGLNEMQGSDGQDAEAQSPAEALE